METWFLDGKTPNSTKMVLINILAIASRSPYYSKGKNSGKKTLFFSKSYKNAVIRLFWHAEIISAVITELNPTVFEKNAKKKNN